MTVKTHAKNPVREEKQMSRVDLIRARHKKRIREMLAEFEADEVPETNADLKFAEVED